MRDSLGIDGWLFFAVGALLAIGITMVLSTSYLFSQERFSDGTIFFRKQLTAAGKRHEFHTYPAAQHAFFNDTRPEVHDPAAAADAWSKTIAFLKQELKA